MSDHDRLVKIYDAIYEEGTGLKAQVLKSNLILIGNGEKGLAARVEDIEHEHALEKENRSNRERRVYVLAGALSSIVGFVMSFWRK